MPYLLNISKIDRQSLHFWIYFFSLCLLIISIPTSRFGINISQILMGANWLAEGQFKDKFKKISGNKPAIALILIYVLHIIGLLWTENLKYALGSDLTTKLPILTLTLVITTSPSLDIKKVRILLLLFIATVLTVSLIGFRIYLTGNFIDFRELTPFASHLYFNMMLIISSFLAPWLSLQISKDKKFIFASFVISVWLIFFLFLTRSLSGLISLSSVFIFLMIWIIINHKAIAAKLGAILTIIASIVVLTLFLSHMHKIATHEIETDFSSLDLYTAQNNPYHHDTTRTVRENGNLVYIYICDKELEESWNKKSKKDYYDHDKSGHIIRYTLLRYMASKGLRKDAKHFEMLNDQDIKAIENGVTNYKYHNWSGIHIRMYETMMGLKKYREANDPDWSTLTQRLELWKASSVAFQKKPFIGWGTGSVFEAVRYGLEKNNSQLEKRHMKPHNQYLVFILSFGSLGFLLFLSFYIYTIYKTRAYKILSFNVFIIVFAADMLGNNPLDAQYGITMFMLFTLLFCFLYPDSNKHNDVYHQ